MQLSDADLHAILRTLFSMQATLSSIAISILLYLLPRFRRNADKVLDNVLEELPETRDGMRDFFRKYMQMVTKHLYVRVTLFVLAVGPTLTVQIYLHRFVDDFILANVITGVFLVAVMMFISAISREAGVD